MSFDDAEDVPGRQIVLLEEHDPQSAAGGIARDTGSVDAAADNGEIEVSH